MSPPPVAGAAVRKTPTPDEARVFFAPANVGRPAPASRVDAASACLPAFTNAPEAPIADPVDALDLAELVAAKMLMRAFRRAGRKISLAGDATVAFVRTPSGDWARPAANAWKAIVANGVGPVDGNVPTRGGSYTWLSFVRSDGPPKPRERAMANAAVSEAVRHGVAVVGFAPGSDHLPQGLVLRADLRLELLAPTPDDVDAAVRITTSFAPAGLLSTEEAARLTPALLLLARRPGQDGDAYIADLRHLAAKIGPACRDLPRSATPRSNVPNAVRLLTRAHGK